MPKRFTATEKWQDPWFCNLSYPERLFWLYLLDTCNHAGIWQVNWPLVKFYLPDLAFNEKTFKERIKILTKDKWFIPKFISFQYGELNQDNRAHLSVINILKKEGAYKGLTSSLLGAKDKDKDKDKDKVKEEYIYIMNLWNSLCDSHPSLKKILQITGTRKTHLKERFLEPSFKDFGAITEAIKKQPFLISGNPSSLKHKDWRISFDWIIANDTNYVKVLEKRYEKEEVPDYKKYLKYT